MHYCTICLHRRSWHHRSSETSSSNCVNTTDQNQCSLLNVSTSTTAGSSLGNEIPTACSSLGDEIPTAGSSLGDEIPTAGSSLGDEIPTA